MELSHALRRLNVDGVLLFIGMRFVSGDKSKMLDIGGEIFKL